MFLRKFLERYHFVLCFVLLQLFSLFVYALTKEKGAPYFNSLGVVVAEKTKYLDAYLNLKNTNAALLKENEGLKNQLYLLQKKADTLIAQKLIFDVPAYTAAKVVLNKYKNRNNILVIDKGRIDGVISGAGVLSDDGLVGVVLSVSEHHSIVLSILNTYNKVSVCVKGGKYFASLYWQGDDAHFMSVEDLDAQERVSLGDTIVTHTNSYEFPEGLPVGVVSQVDKISADLQNLQVKLFNDMRALYSVYVFDTPYRDEIKKIQDSIQYF